MLLHRPAILKLVVGIAVPFILAAVVEPLVFQTLQDHGALKNPETWTWAAFVFLTRVFETRWFQILTALVVGVGLGSCLDTLLRRRESLPIEAQSVQDRIDRLQLADEARALSRHISALLGESSENAVIANNDDMNQFRTNPGTIWERRTRIEARAVGKFHEKYYSEFRRIIATAQKCVALDFGQIWHLSHGMSHYSDIQRVPDVLEKIAVDLNHPQPDIPMIRMLPTKADAVVASNNPPNNS